MGDFFKRLILRCLQTGMLGVIFTLAFLFVAWRAFEFEALLYGFYLGVLVGFSELFFYRRISVKSTFLFSLLKIIGYVVIVLTHVALVQILSDSFSVKIELGALTVSKDDTYLVMAQSIFNAFLIRVYIQVESIIGINTFPKLIFGRYLNPRKENRFFMFIDLNGSTSIAEELGDDDYYSFLNAFFRDLSLPVFKTNAEIYKYIGDEVILTWPEKSGKKNNQVIKLYYEFRKNILKNRSFYLKRFGHVPEFKAGLHYGEVISARVGDLKKELAFNGDVLNTAARIVETCKPLHRPFLISECAYLALEEDIDRKVENIKNVRLDGKVKRINLYAIH